RSGQKCLAPRNKKEFPKIVL
ncbi:Rrf2 family transcriptional regulator, partial [Enterococcus faecalis]